MYATSIKKAKNLKTLIMIEQNQLEHQIGHSGQTSDRIPIKNIEEKI